MNQLFRPDDKYHRRKDGKVSEFITDVVAMGKYFNGNAKAKDHVPHHCWDEETNLQCCPNDMESQDTAVVVSVNGLLSRSDPVPAESTWTHTIRNMKMTVFRRLAYKIGTNSIAFAPTPEVGQIQVDGEAVENQAHVVQKTRVNRLRDYYSNDHDQHQNVVLTTILDYYDYYLLYPLLGDPVADAADTPCKMEMVLDPEETLIGKALQSFLACLDNWSEGGDLREPWFLLDLSDAPLHDQSFYRLWKIDLENRQ